MVKPAVNFNSNLKMVFIDKIDVCLIGENRASTCSLCVKSAVSSVISYIQKNTPNHEYAYEALHTRSDLKFFCEKIIHLFSKRR